MALLRRIFILVSALLIAGCTTIGMEPYLEKNPQALAHAKEIAGHPDRATVFFYRRYPIGTPNPGVLPPYQFAVNGQLISAMPVGSYVVLSLPPGNQKLTRLSENRWKDTGYDRYDLEVSTEPGKSYYVGASNGLSIFSPLQQDGTDAGERFLQHALLAKLYHYPVSVDAFLARTSAVKQGRRNAGAAPITPLPSVQTETTSRSMSSDSASISNSGYLPSAQQVTDALEVIAVVAFIGLLLVGGAALAASAGGGANVSLPPTLPPLSAEVATVNRAQTRSASSQATVLEPIRTRSGITASVAQTETIREIRLTNGMKFRVEDNQVYGNGMHGRIVGPKLMMDNGQSYQVQGSTAYSSDGRSCKVTGRIVSCD